MAIDHSFAIVMTKLNAGDPQAAAEIFQKYVRRLIALANRHFEARFRPKVDPEDVVQSVYQSFFRRNNRSPYELADWDSLWALLAKITVRKCYNRQEFWRAARRDIGRETQPDPDSTLETLWEPVDHEQTPLEATIVADTLERLFSQFEPQQRTIAEMMFQGYNSPEIAAMCECSERTVARVLKRLRKQLRELEAAD